MVVVVRVESLALHEESLLVPKVSLMRHFSLILLLLLNSGFGGLNILFVFIVSSLIYLSLVQVLSVFRVSQLFPFFLQFLFLHFPQLLQMLLTLPLSLYFPHCRFIKFLNSFSLDSVNSLLCLQVTQNLGRCILR
jgi:hypothetical protein